MSGTEEQAGQKEGRQQRKSILLRLDPAIHEALAKWAADDLRSLNAHIELLLRDALRESGREVRARPIRRPGRPRRDEPGGG